MRMAKEKNRKLRIDSHTILKNWSVASLGEGVAPLIEGDTSTVEFDFKAGGD